MSRYSLIWSTFDTEVTCIAIRSQTRKLVEFVRSSFRRIIVSLTVLSMKNGGIEWLLFSYSFSLSLGLRLLVTTGAYLIFSSSVCPWFGFFPCMVICDIDLFEFFEFVLYLMLWLVFLCHFLFFSFLFPVFFVVCFVGVCVWLKCRG